MGVSSLSGLAHYFMLILVFLYDEVTVCYQHSPIYYRGIRIIVCCECCLEVNLFDQLITRSRSVAGFLLTRFISLDFLI